MRKIITIVGTRPELIRLSEIIKKLDQFTNNIFVYTGQNYTYHLYDQFFKDFNLRRPNYELNLDKKLSGFGFIGNMFVDVDNIIKKEKPDLALILGDTNSCLSAYVCRRNNVPVFHLEAGNRCYDDKVPEELNRRIVDSLSTFLLPYTQRSRENLLQEGYHTSKIFVIGNPISEIINLYLNKNKKNSKEHLLVTLHREENLTNIDILQNITKALNILSKDYKIIFSIHPKLKEMLNKYDIKLLNNIIAKEPFGFKEFLDLEQTSLCVLTDSGTVPEECSILKIPCVLLRTSTERTELLENNSMILSGIRTDDIINNFNVAINMNIGDIPNDYKDINISEKILKILLRNL